MLTLDSAFSARLHSSKPITSGSIAFSVPKSPLSSAGAAPFGRSVGKGTLASDSVELSGSIPATPGYGAVYGPPLAGVRQEQPFPAFGFGRDNAGSEPSELASDESVPSGLKADPDEAGTGKKPAGEGKTEMGASGKTESGESGEGLTEEEQRQIDTLKGRDLEVRAHESAHQAVGGQYAGAMSLEYQQGPDGRRYAVGGEVSIDISAENDPEATVSKMRQVRAAALAPAQPSGQDLAVAAQASKLEAQANQEAGRQQAEESRPDAPEEDGAAAETGKTNRSETGAGAGNAESVGAADRIGTPGARGAADRVESPPAGGVGVGESIANLASPGSGGARRGSGGPARFGRVPVDIYA